LPHILTEPLTGGDLNKLLVCNVSQKFQVEQAENIVQNASGKKKSGISDFLQKYWYIDIPVSFVYTNTHLHACTHTYEHIKWIRFILNLLTTAATLFTSQRQPYTLQKSSGRKISKTECTGF